MLREEKKDDTGALESARSGARVNCYHWDITRHGDQILFEWFCLPRGTEYSPHDHWNHRLVLCVSALKIFFFKISTTWLLQTGLCHKSTNSTSEKIIIKIFFKNSQSRIFLKEKQIPSIPPCETKCNKTLECFLFSIFIFEFLSSCLCLLHFISSVISFFLYFKIFSHFFYCYFLVTK